MTEHNALADHRLVGQASVPPSVAAPFYDLDGITIYQADCRVVLPEIPSESIDFILTDPPYGHRYHDRDLATRANHVFDRKVPTTARTIANDGPEADTLAQLLFTEARRLLKPGGVLCCFAGGGGPDPQCARWSLWLASILSFKQLVVWDKGPMGLGIHYRPSYETIIVATKPGAPIQWYDKTASVENIIRDIPKTTPRDHPTPKPVLIAEHFLQLHTRPGDRVLDPFMGAGTTLIAAKNGGRQAIGIELETTYCKTARTRLAQAVLPLHNNEQGDNE